jgi:DedD protein
MEKEMKKLLLVAVSVGFFLLVTITVAIIVLTPKTKDNAVAANIPYSSGRVKNWDEIPPTPATEIKEPEKTNITETDKNDGNNLTIIIPSPDAETTADVVQTDKPKEIVQPVVAVKPPEPVKPAEKPAVKPAAAVKPTTTVKPSAPPAKKTINDFWVQTGAFAAQVRAEDAREILAAKGITSIIENREINGKIWYRVRLGPYTSEREANHWLEIVKLIDGFNDSQIRQTARAQ